MELKLVEDGVLVDQVNAEPDSASLSSTSAPSWGGPSFSWRSHHHPVSTAYTISEVFSSWAASIAFSYLIVKDANNK